VNAYRDYLRACIKNASKKAIEEYGIEKLADGTGIEPERIDELVAGEGRSITAIEAALIVFALDREIDESDQDPLLRKLRLVVEQDQPRFPRDEVIRAIRKLFADLERECEEQGL
jgi:hypothetical protein